MQPSPQQLHGKVALITGASSGIGREAARLFARHGARLVLTARRQPELQALVAEIEQDGGQAIALAGDVRDEDRKSTRLNSSHLVISYAVFCLKKKKEY